MARKQTRPDPELIVLASVKLPRAVHNRLLIEKATRPERVRLGDLIVEAVMDRYGGRPAVPDG